MMPPALTAAGFDVSLPVYADLSFTLADCLSTGLPALDRLLPGGGWPVGGTVEIRLGAGVDPITHLLLPALATLSWESRWITLINPPQLPQAATLTQRGVDISRLLVVHPSGGESPLGLASRAMGSGHCGAVLAWHRPPPTRQERHALRRLQGTLQRHRGLAFILTPDERLAPPSLGIPAGVQLRLDRGEWGESVELLRCHHSEGRRLRLGRGASRGYPQAAFHSPLAAKRPPLLCKR